MARIVHGTFPGPAGALEYILNEAVGAPRPLAAVVCHPHPLYRGTMHTRIVFHTAKVLSAQGIPALRFHFRGVGQSAGAYDHGRGESGDLRAAMAFLQQSHPGPLLLAGFSFGATMVVKLLAAEDRQDVVRALLLGLPVDSGALPTAWAWHGPKLLISGDRDQFAALPSLETYFAALAEPKQRIWIAGGDHFLTGHMEEYRTVLGTALPQTGN